MGLLFVEWLVDYYNIMSRPPVITGRYNIVNSPIGFNHCSAACLIKKEGEKYWMIMKLFYLRQN